MRNCHSAQVNKLWQENFTASTVIHITIIVSTS